MISNLSPNIPTRLAERFIARSISRWRFIACVQVFDFVIFSIIAFRWLWGLSHPAIHYWWLIYILVSFLISTTVNRVFESFRLYNFDTLTAATKSATRALTAGVISTAPLTVMLFTRSDLSLGILTASGLTTLGLLTVTIARLPIAHLATKLQQHGMVKQRYFIVANSHAAISSLETALKLSEKSRIVGKLALFESESSLEESLLQGCDFLRDHAVDAIVLKLPLSQPERIAAAVRVLRSVPRQILLAPTFDGIDNIQLPEDIVGLGSPNAADQPILVQITDRPLAGWRWIFKDIQDRFIALILLIGLAPVMILAALAVKIACPGPVFFLQRRRGYGGKTFNIIKFRTMRVADESARSSNALQLTTRNDPRVFPVGRILRRTSLDELPQLLNVLKGDMWIVGPRPHSPFAQAGGQAYADAVKDYGARYRLKPGITGWAQVSGWRGPTDTVEQLKGRVEFDLVYVENWSMWFDIRILFKTLSCAFGHKNAF